MRDQVNGKLSFPDSDLKEDNIALVKVVKNSPIMGITTRDRKYFTSTEWTYFYDTNSYVVRDLTPCDRHVYR